MNLVYYNDTDAFCASWLRELIDVEALPHGHVCELDIRTLRADHLGLTSHFFAGIGGWPYALDLAGWPRDVPVWSGSAPCQPFSAAGRKEGFDDERHLWPFWQRLIEECEPPIVFGEQIASPLGRAWLDLVFTDLEALDYACAAADLCCPSIGGPHIRQRLFWVAIASDERRQRLGLHLRRRRQEQDLLEARRGREARGLGNRASTRRARAGCEGSGRHAGAVSRAQTQSPETRFAARRVPDELIPSGATRGPWADAEWWLCRDNKIRPAQPGVFPLGDELPNRLGRLRGYGNAIVPHVAAEFIGAVMGELIEEGL